MDGHDSSRRSRVWDVGRVFLKLGAISYGGPALVGIMQAEIQEKRAWVSRERFVEGLALVNLLPGPLAAQVSIVLGYGRAGWMGGLVGGACFILPAYVIMLGLTLFYTRYGALPAMRGVFYGLGPVVLGIFAMAVYRLGKSAITDVSQAVIAVGSALLVGLTPLGIVPGMLLAGAVGVARYGSRAWGVGTVVAGAALFSAPFWGVHWLPTSGLSGLTGGSAGLATPGPWQLGVFFFKVGAFTFGGGLAILAFVQEQVVSQFHWLSPQEFLDGLALGQLTPGPIIMLAAFVGYRVAGVWGSLVSGVAIFLPSFLLVLAVLPAFDRVKRVTWMRAALRGIGPAVIGMIAVALLQMTPHAVPDVGTGLMAVVTVVLMIVWRLGALPLMAGGGAVGVALRAAVGSAR
jgi:chromate transporter